MCRICGKTPCDCRCPNDSPPETNFFCEWCGYGILPGETYVENADGECIHTDCAVSMPVLPLLQWAGCTVKENDRKEWNL